MYARLHPSVKILIQVGCLFLPGIPTLLWFWPYIDSTGWQRPAQVFMYVYFLIGAVAIGRRRWNWQQLGFSRNGLRLSLICGAAIVAGRMLVMFSLDRPPPSGPLDLMVLIGDVIFYFDLVGLTEELLFRGVLYRALDEWHGARLAIWGSSLAFGLYHLGSQGVIGAIGTGFVGLILATIRWRAGSIVGLVLTHGMMDITSQLMLPTLDVEQLVHTGISQPGWLLPGYALLLIVPIYLWKFYHPVNLDRRTT